ncbi:hypothetical protein ACIPW9_31375 [Streptomyces sp. NPDC090052]|nr:MULTISPECIES: hypothetical protein [unclassified Streptomyces]MCX4724713.1 hypothetical protein [Streptomyces sp. NBC_01306]WSV05800.1 hypothetical protein OG372_20835 [Streptomyces sp. NBC_01020]WSX43886.1 hypothetical protein OG760_20575 [Streptomyces sp. NBC_00963]WSX68075.1 hypothetical protein OG221_16365 [Streptomyces sp. NBC_00932]
MFNRLRHGTCRGLSPGLVDGLALVVLAASITTVVTLIAYL